MIAYEDQASGMMALKDGRMRFVEVTLAPQGDDRRGRSGARQGLALPRAHERLLHRELRELPGPEPADRDPRLIQTRLTDLPALYARRFLARYSSSCGRLRTALPLQPRVNRAGGWSAPLAPDRFRLLFDHLPGVVVLELGGAQIAEG